MLTDACVRAVHRQVHVVASTREAWLKAKTSNAHEQLLMANMHMSYASRRSLSADLSVAVEKPWPVQVMPVAKAMPMVRLFSVHPEIGNSLPMPCNGSCLVSRLPVDVT